MKAAKRRLKLNARIAEWEAIRPDETRKGGKVKIVQGAGFTKPSSLKK